MASPEVVLCTVVSDLKGCDQIACVLDDSSLFFLALEKGQESIGEVEIADVIGLKFCLDEIKVDGFGLGEIEGALDSGV